MRVNPERGTACLYSTRSASLWLAGNGDVWIGWIVGDVADRHRALSRLSTGASAFDPPRKLDPLTGALRSLGTPADPGLVRILPDGAVETVPYDGGGPKRIGDGACPHDPPIRGRGASWLRAADHSAYVVIGDDGSRARVAHEPGPPCGTRLQILNLPENRTEIVWATQGLEGFVWAGKGTAPSRSKGIRIEKGAPAQLAAAADDDGFALLVWAGSEGFEAATAEPDKSFSKATPLETPLRGRAATGLAAASPGARTWVVAVSSDSAIHVGRFRWKH